MGDVGKEIGFQRLDTAQLRHHFVEVQDHIVHVVLLIGAVDGRNIDGEISSRYLPRGLGNLLQRFFVGALGEPGDQSRHPRRDKAPVEDGDVYLDKVAQLQPGQQNNEAHMDAGGQHQPRQNDTEQGQREPAGADGRKAAPHFSTAL